MYVNVEEVKALVKTDLSDAELGSIIDRAEFAIVEIAGKPQTSSLDLSLTETIYGGTQNLFLKRPINSVTSITEDTVLLASTSYRIYTKQGRVVRLPLGSIWGDVISVVYIPSENISIFKQATIDLVRNIISRTTLQSESIGGEYSYTMMDWKKEARVIARGLYFKSF